MNGPLVRYESFGKRYDEVVAVAELDLEVGEGEVVALIGPNGSGKTTAIKGAVGLLRPTSGRVLVDGLDPIRDGTRVRRLIGYLPQRLSFAERVTAGEVVRLYGALRGLDTPSALDALSQVGLGDVANRRVEDFSGGMTQRLGLAVALMGRPRLILADEPTAALDPTGALGIRDVLQQLRRDGCTILFSSHDLGEVATLADRVAIFSDGRVRASGSIEQLARAYGARLEASAGVGASGPALSASHTLEGIYRAVTCRTELIR
jgi:ABC-type multidrug transport system ATPase subunit